jgi:entericidin A
MCAASPEELEERGAVKQRFALLIAALALLAGCNTFQGFGKDVQKAGEKIEDAAARRK